jgi:hypothetical protein
MKRERLHVLALASVPQKGKPPFSTTDDHTPAACGPIFGQSASAAALQTGGVYSAVPEGLRAFAQSLSTAEKSFANICD